VTAGGTAPQADMVAGGFVIRKGVPFSKTAYAKVI